MPRLIPVIIILTISTLPLFGQVVNEPYLLLKKAGTGKQVVFYEGDEIRFRMRGDDQFRRSLILGLRQDTIRFHYFEVALADLEVIDIRHKSFQRFNYSAGGTKVIMAGMLFLVADYVSHELIQDEPGGLSDQTYIISGAIIGAGILMKFFKKKKFKPGGRYIIDIIDLRQR